MICTTTSGAYRFFSAASTIASLLKRVSTMNFPFLSARAVAPAAPGTKGEEPVFQGHYA